MTKQATANKSKSNEFSYYANLAEAANDLNLQLPNECYTLSPKSEPTTTRSLLFTDKIIYVRLIDNANLSASNQTGYRNITAIADIYTWEYGRVNRYLVKPSDDILDATTYQSLKDWLSANVSSDSPTLCYCRANGRDLFFSARNKGPSLTFHRANGKCNYLDYKGYLIECDHVNERNNSTDAISPIQRWTELKKLVQPGKIDLAARAFWQYSYLMPDFNYFRVNIHRRVADLACAIGYINSYIVNHLGNIYDNSNIDQLGLSAEDVVNHLIGIGILDKEQTSSVVEPNNPDLQVGHKFIADETKVNFFTHKGAYPAAWAGAFDDNVEQFYIDDKLIKFDLITSSNAHDVMPVADYRLADVLVDGLHDYLLRTTSEPVKQYLDECEDSISVYKLLETISGPADFFPSNGDMALFHNCVTKYIVDAGYLARYMSLLFALSQPTDSGEGTEERMSIAMLRCETVKYLMTNLDWILSIYDFDDAILPIVETYGVLNLGGGEWTVPYEYNLRHHFIASILQADDRNYLATINQRVNDLITDPSENNDNCNIVYTNSLK